MNLSFYIENNRWYADIPDYIEAGGTQGDLEMVEGADTFLAMLAEGEDWVHIHFDINPFDQAEELVKFKDGDFFGGAYYKLKTYENQILDWEMWLCDLLKYVFYFIPEVIYFKKLS